MNAVDLRQSARRSQGGAWRASTPGSAAGAVVALGVCWRAGGRLRRRGRKRRRGRSGGRRCRRGARGFAPLLHLDRAETRDIALVLLEVLREGVAAGPVGDEEDFLGARRIGGGLERGAARIGD